MKIQALDIKVGDRIVAYCKQKMQPCTVRRLLNSTQSNIILRVSTSVPYRESACCVIQFHREALVELVGLKSCSQAGEQLLTPSEAIAIL